jgi:hypothetical protein
MKKLTFTIAFCLFGYIGFSQASTYVNPYVKKNGTVVEGYNRTLPNNTNLNNYSTQGNTNPYTGSQGTKPREYSSESQQLRQNHNIQTGPRGGQYYINSNGNKTYVPKNNN